MDELIKQLENTRNFVFYCPDDKEAIEKAIEYLKQYAEIKKLVDEWNNLPENMQTYISMLGTFMQILNVFKEAD